MVPRRCRAVLHGGREFVDEALAVVPDDPAADAAVVVLVFDALAPAGVQGLSRHDTFVVVIFEVLATDEPPAGRLL
jgi:hypothetical protein